MISNTNILLKSRSRWMFALVLGLKCLSALGAIDPSEWGIPKDYVLEIDTQGYKVPTQLAFVPNPGKDPKDPLYYVGQLFGEIKVVSNDRTVTSFADGFVHLEQKGEGFESFGNGLIGLCTDPANGYLFATFAYDDDKHLRRNNIIRFSTKPQKFGLKPTESKLLPKAFGNEITSTWHQVGACAVHKGYLYVTVGDALKAWQAQDLKYSAGKVLRMTLDGEPVPDNPFYTKDGQTTAEDYIWAKGFRNPQGLSFVGDRLFLAEDGLNLDRFVEIFKGANYFWDSTDNSTGTRADFIFSPAPCPVQMDYLDDAKGKAYGMPKEMRGRFYMGAAGDPDRLPLMTGIFELNFDLAKRVANEVPKYIVRYLKKELQIIVGVALGPDGLYFGTMIDAPYSQSAIYKLKYKPGAVPPATIHEEYSGEGLINSKGCLTCHMLHGQGKTVGPDLTPEALQSRALSKIQSEEYHKQLESIASHTTSLENYDQVRKKILSSKNLDDLRFYVMTKLKDPTFDNPATQMPNFMLTDSEREAIANYLVPVDGSATQKWYQRLPLPPVRWRFVIIAFCVGGLLGWIVRPKKKTLF